MMTSKNKFKVLKEKMSDDSGAISTVEMIIIIAIVVTIATVVFRALQTSITNKADQIDGRIQGIDDK